MLEGSGRWRLMEGGRKVMAPPLGCIGWLCVTAYRRYCHTWFHRREETTKHLAPRQCGEPAHGRLCRLFPLLAAAAPRCLTDLRQRSGRGPLDTANGSAVGPQSTPPRILGRGAAEKWLRTTPRLSRTPCPRRLAATGAAVRPQFGRTRGRAGEPATVPPRTAMRDGYGRHTACPVAAAMAIRVPRRGVPTTHIGGGPSRPLAPRAQNSRRHRRPQGGGCPVWAAMWPLRGMMVHWLRLWQPVGAFARWATGVATTTHAQLTSTKTGEGMERGTLLGGVASAGPAGACMVSI